MDNSLLEWCIVGIFYGCIYIAFARKKTKWWISAILVLLGPLAPVLFIVIFMVYIIRIIKKTQADRKKLKASRLGKVLSPAEVEQRKKIKAIAIPVGSALIACLIIFIVSVVLRKSPQVLISDLFGLFSRFIESLFR